MSRTATLERRTGRGAAARRGVALLAFVTALLVVGVMVSWLSYLSGSTSLSYLGHYFSSGALYAAESGQDMAMREYKSGADYDGDGTAGTISNDGNDGNDPTLVSGSFHVSVSTKKYTSIGLWQNHRRVTEVTIQ
ncbi:MAG: hypothetical protein U1A27_05955 [Phycisphaerae bacterium]